MKAVTVITLLGLLAGRSADKLESASNSYLPPAEASASEADYQYGDDDYGEVPEDQQAGYGEDAEGRASESVDSDAMNLKMLMGSVPGTPGEDYPIYATAPDTDFSCQDKVAGGYYADPAAECQAYHICGAGYARLCPNGTIFNQEKFICDWWFNFDCGEAESFYGRNDEIAAEREAIDGAASEAVGRDDLGDVSQYGEAGEEAAASAPTDSYLPPAGRRGRKNGRRGRKNVAAKQKKNQTGKGKKKSFVNKRIASKKKGKAVRERSRNGKSKRKGSSQKRKNKANVKTSRKQKKSGRSGRKGKSGQNSRSRKTRTNVAKKRKGRKAATKG